MQRTISILVFFSLILSSCRFSSVRPATATPAATALPAATPGAEEEALVQLPLQVGEGVSGGSFDLYFTDPSSPIASQLTGGPDAALAEAIDAAHLSVDAGLYSLSLYSIRQALVRAHRRGVDVRLVMESDNMNGSAFEALVHAGIPVVGDERPGLMHDKFVVIDRNEVWTGSMNLTDDSAYADRNNLLRIRSPKVAEDYETEFREMFLDGKFGGDKGSATPNPRVILDGTPLDIYFSPDDHVQAALIDLLDNAQSSIYFLAYSFTADPLADAILKRAAAGVRVAGVMDADQVETNIGTKFDAFRAAKLDVRLDGEPGLLHDKVLIVDGQVVVTGSYNFSSSAEKTNDENLIVIYSPEVAAQYLQEFHRIYAAAQP